MMTNSFVQHFGLKGPLVLAPLAGGPYTPRLAAAVAEAGALASVGAAYMGPNEMIRTTQELRQFTKRPFVINLFAPEPVRAVSASELKAALEATQVYREEWKLPPPLVQPPYHENFDAQFATMLDLKPAAFSYVFGLLDDAHVRACQSRGIYLIGAATTPEEAERVQASGADAVVCQGVEAGGHRAILNSQSPDPGISTLDLVRASARRLHIPIIAAGGLMTGADIAGALKAGAQAAQLGTAFLCTEEAGTSPAYRKALHDPTPTELTRVFSGRWARGMSNRFLEEMKGKPILPFQAQNKLTRDLRQACHAHGSSELLSLWAGAGVHHLREGRAADLVRTLFLEIESA
ncbi:MAG: nitronate monooxygenase [Bdellovibrionaceae bacterium]|nr:nitronate monooxygenase [Pseudobdellovibrionaceae bacterium]